MTPGKKNKIRSVANTVLIMLWLLPIWLNPTCIYAQTQIQKIDRLPSKEVQDLHVDKKGYLWIAHSLGISRYDGLNYIHFTHPQLTSLKMMDIVEDRQGRIWCHNFSGQLFYIENGRLKFLDAYQFKKETQSPRMVLCGDEIVVTSHSGLFVLSTVTMKGVYTPIAGLEENTLMSLAVTGDKVVVFSHPNWYLYQQGRSVQQLVVDPAIEASKEHEVTLQPVHNYDTLYLVTNPAGTLQKLILRNNLVSRVARIEYNDYINSVTRGDRVWINTRNKSITADGSLQIAHFNLTDVVTGKEGNQWLGSLKDGLLVNFHVPAWKKISFPVGSDDFVRSIAIADGYFFAGTQKGALLLMKEDNSTPVWRKDIFNGYGSIDFIRYFENNRFLVGTSTKTYIVNPFQKIVESELPIKSISAIDFDHNTFYCATSNGLFILPFRESNINLSKWRIDKQVQFPFYAWDKLRPDSNTVNIQRNQATAVVQEKNTIYLSTKNGLHQVNQQGIQPFLIHGKEVYASSLSGNDKRLYIATIDNGLWIKKEGVYKHFSTSNYLLSNVIVQIKLIGKHLWIFEDKGIQVLNVTNESIISHLDFPKIVGADVFDVAEKNGFAYLTTVGGIYKIPMNFITEKRTPSGYLDYIVVNNSDTLSAAGIDLAHNKNDIQFFFSSPAFYDPEAVSFKYRLKGSDDKWQITKPDERMLRFSSLSPGSYSFEAIAVNKDGLQQGKPIRFGFTILKAWWTQWWFIALVNLIVVGIVVFIIWNRVDQRLKVEVIRRGIASDLHDDIGATLSSINIYTEMAQEEVGHNQNLVRIKENINDTIARLDDLVWSINPRNDSMEQLIQRMQHLALVLLESTGVKSHFNYDPKVLLLKFNLANKRNVYLLFKEMLNNVIKHAQCRNCYIDIKHSERHIILSVTDDGIGFDTTADKKNRNGLENMRYRAGRMNGNVKISSSPKNGSEIVVQLKAGLV